MADYQWFIEPLDGLTNESIAKTLEELDWVDTLVSLMDADGKAHNVYRVHHNFITMLRKSKHPFKYQIFNRQGENGALRLWKFTKKKKSKKKDKKK